jgi:hypothetical protein
VKKIVLRNLRGEKKKFNGKEGIFISANKSKGEGGINARCCGLPFELKKHQYREIEE